MFDLSQLRCFVAVAEELHFGRAATRLNMTQPPLSRQIKILEHALNAALFVRTSRSVRITPAGRSFLPEAKRLLKLAESAALVAQSIASGRAGSIKIGFTGGAAQAFLPALITECRARLADVELILKEMVSGDQIDALEAGQIDVGFLRPPVSRASFSSVAVLSESLIAAIPHGHRLARQKEIAIRDLDGEPFVMYAPFEARYFYDLLAGQFAKAKVLPRYVQHLSQIHSILSLVGTGLGLALVPQSAAMLHAERVVLRPIRLTPARPVELHMAWRRHDENPLLPGFLTIARGLAARARRG
ncbi:MAG TPA: LysR substrate-binding domain-containing protein [Xanthobacteraceae bacterium]|nr:LysR substrate-binding domain-containing protein [Xanthobacteraceae bacterium]